VRITHYWRGRRRRKRRKRKRPRFSFSQGLFSYRVGLEGLHGSFFLLM